METNNRSQREKILRNFISGSEFAAIRISSVVGDQNDIFLCTTATGNLQLIRLGEIGYFRYNSKGRQWEAMLYDGHVLKLKRSVNSQMILNYHPFLTQISQSFILNISYLVLIKENNCVLLPPFNAVENLQITPPFFEEAQRKISEFLSINSSSK